MESHQLQLKVHPTLYGWCAWVYKAHCSCGWVQEKGHTTKKRARLLWFAHRDKMVSDGSE